MQRSNAWDESRLPIHKPNTLVTNEALVRNSSHFQNGAKQDIKAMALSHSPFDQRQPKQTLRLINHPAEHQNFARTFKTIHKLSGAWNKAWTLLTNCIGNNSSMLTTKQWKGKIGKQLVIIVTSSIFWLPRKLLYLDPQHRLKCQMNLEYLFQVSSCREK